MPLGPVTGVRCGVVISAVTGNIGLWIPIGTGIGLGVGLATGAVLSAQEAE